MLGQWIGSLVSIPYRARYEPRMAEFPFRATVAPAEVFEE